MHRLLHGIRRASCWPVASPLAFARLTCPLPFTILNQPPGYGNLLPSGDEDEGDLQPQSAEDGKYLLPPSQGDKQEDGEGLLPPSQGDEQDDGEGYLQPSHGDDVYGLLLAYQSGESADFGFSTIMRDGKPCVEEGILLSAAHAKPMLSSTDIRMLISSKAVQNLHEDYLLPLTGDENGEGIRPSQDNKPAILSPRTIDAVLKLLLSVARTYVFDPGGLSCLPEVLFASQPASITEMSHAWDAATLAEKEPALKMTYEGELRCQQASVDHAATRWMCGQEQELSEAALGVAGNTQPCKGALDTVIPLQARAKGTRLPNPPSSLYDSSVLEIRTMRKSDINSFECDIEELAFISPMPCSQDHEFSCLLPTHIGVRH